MASKTYFKIAIGFMILYILSSFGVVGGLPTWVHRVCAIGFVVMIFTGIRRKKKENKPDEL